MLNLHICMLVWLNSTPLRLTFHIDGAVFLRPLCFCFKDFTSRSKKFIVVEYDRRKWRSESFLIAYTFGSFIANHCKLFDCWTWFGFFIHRNQNILENKNLNKINYLIAKVFFSWHTNTPASWLCQQQNYHHSHEKLFIIHFNPMYYFKSFSFGIWLTKIVSNAILRLIVYRIFSFIKLCKNEGLFRKKNKTKKYKYYANKVISFYSILIWAIKIVCPLIKRWNAQAFQHRKNEMISILVVNIIEFVSYLFFL